MADSLRWRWLQAILEDEDLPSTTRLVLFVLSFHMNKLGANCYPGLTILSRETALDRRTVQRHLDTAEELGWIERERERRESGAWGRTTYFPAIPEPVGADNHHVSGDVAAEDHHLPEEGGDVGAQDHQGGGSVPPPRGGSVPPKTVETDSETEELPVSAHDPNWVARAVDEVWRARTGGVFAYGRMGKALKPLVDEHGAHLVLEALDHYLARHADEGRLDYATPEGLAQKFGAEISMMEDGDFAARSQDLLARAEK